MTKPAPLPLLGQMAPNMQAHFVRWSCGAGGLAPRFAQRRVILFAGKMIHRIIFLSRSLWPIRAFATGLGPVAACVELCWNLGDGA